MLSRADNTLSLIKDILSECKAKNISNVPLLESIVAQYLAVVFYADVEKEVIEIIKSRIGRINDAGVANLIVKTQEKILTRIPKGELSQTVKLFGDTCSERFQADCDAVDVSFYNNLIGARHNTAHPGSTSISIEGVAEGLEAGKRILQTFTTAIHT